MCLANYPNSQICVHHIFLISSVFILVTNLALSVRRSYHIIIPLCLNPYTFRSLVALWLSLYFWLPFPSWARTVFILFGVYVSVSVRDIRHQLPGEGRSILFMLEEKQGYPDNTSDAPSDA